MAGRCLPYGRQAKCRSCERQNSAMAFFHLKVIFSGMKTPASQSHLTCSLKALEWTMLTLNPNILWLQRKRFWVDSLTRESILSLSVLLIQDCGKFILLALRLLLGSEWPPGVQILSKPKFFSTPRRKQTAADFPGRGCCRSTGVDAQSWQPNSKWEYPFQQW